MQYSCFISYRHNENNQRFYKNLKYILQSEIFNITNKQKAFFAKDALLIGQELDTIYYSIENSFFFFPVWVENYLHKDNLWCARELYHALALENLIKAELPNDVRLRYSFIFPLVYRNINGLPDCLSNKISENIKDLEYAITNLNITDEGIKKMPLGVVEFKQRIHDSLCIYHGTLNNHMESINLKDLFAKIEKPDDERIEQWIKQLQKETRNKESKNFQLLKKTDD